MPDNSVKLHRVLKATPEKVYRAFTETNALASWLPPYGFLCVVHEIDVRVGGSYKMSFINFSTGNGHSFGGKYLEIKSNEFLKYTDKFDDSRQSFTSRGCLCLSQRASHWRACK